MSHLKCACEKLKCNLHAYTSVEIVHTLIRSSDRFQNKNDKMIRAKTQNVR